MPWTSCRDRHRGGCAGLCPDAQGWQCPKVGSDTAGGAKKTHTGTEEKGARLRWGATIHSGWRCETARGVAWEKEVRRLEPNPRDLGNHNRRLGGCTFCKRRELKKRPMLRYDLVSKLQGTAGVREAKYHSSPRQKGFGHKLREWSRIRLFIPWKYSLNASYMLGIVLGLETQQ